MLAAMPMQIQKIASRYETKKPMAITSPSIDLPARPGKPLPSPLPLSKHQIPHHKPRTQSNGPPKHRLRRTPALRRALELLISPIHVALRGIHVADQLRDVLFLRGQMRDEGFLERGYFQERFFGVSGRC